MANSDRRSMPGRAAKGKRKPDELVPQTPTAKRSRASDNDSPVGHTMAYRWIDAGEPRDEGGRNHKLLEIRSLVKDGESSILTVGDCVLLRSSDKDDSFNSPGKYDEMDEDDDPFVARIEAMWEDTPRNKKNNKPQEHYMKIRARWFFKKQDIEALTGSFTGPISRFQLLGSMTSRDLVVSDQYDDNDVLVILRKCQVVMRRPSENEEPLPPLPDGSFLSRFSLSFVRDGGAVLKAYQGDDEKWPPLAVANADSAQISGGSESKSATDGGDPKTATSMSSDDSDDSSSSSSFSEEERLPETEGTTTKGSILVGYEHQAEVPKFQGKQPVKSRNPIMIWKPNSISDEDLQAYLDGASKILTPFVEKNELTMEDPYIPLSEHVLGRETSGKVETLSSICTATVMSTTKNKLTRECMVDAILELLTKHDYNTQEALKVIEESPRDFVTVWTKTEKESFNTGFRRFSGSLRMISKGMLSSKNFKDIVDYHYRFKIPDQFRSYQEKKREQAARMLEFIEKRRGNENSALPPRVDGFQKHAPAERKKVHDWSKTNVNDVVGAVEDRRVAAKQLLLQIKSELGAEKMAQIADAIKGLQQGSIADLKEQAVDLLQAKPDLLDKFLEFLPKRFRI